MVWSRFLDDKGDELPDGTPVPVSGKTHMFIISPKMRGEVHQKRIEKGTRFFMVEGSRKVANGKVISILALYQNLTD
jgi:heptaprenylglyceryl phosphate synthase